MFFTAEVTVLFRSILSNDLEKCSKL